MFTQLMMLSSGLLLTSGMRRTWLLRLGIIHVCGRKVPWSLFPAAGFAVAGSGVYLPAPELALQDGSWSEAGEYGDAGIRRVGPSNEKSTLGSMLTLLRFSEPGSGWWWVHHWC